ncbi:MAG: cold shock domain-containing protein [Bacteroidetes bacterium]|nr:MAG: cold shock domain-containing protein [Bacteroidota bacterium]
MADTFSKKEREKKKRRKKEAKAARRELKKSGELTQTSDIMYVDEFGHFTETPPDPKAKTKIRLEDIRVSVPKDEELEAEESLHTGRVKFFNEEKGYGFILDDVSGQSLFVHAKNLIEPIIEGNQVQYEMGNGPKGPVAVEVKLR